MTAQGTTYRSLFAVGGFRLLFGGMLMSVFGYTFEVLALSVLVYARSHSAFLAAVAFSIGLVPQVIGGLLLTSLADLLSPRLVITAGLLLRGVPGLLIGLLPAMPIPVMLVTIAVPAVVTPVYSAAIAKILPGVLGGDRYVLGQSVLNLTAAGAQIAGMAAGGTILALLPARWLMLTAGSLLLSAALWFGLHPISAPGHAPRTAGWRGGFWIEAVRATLSGNAALLWDRRIRRLLFANWLPVSISAGAQALIVPYTAALGKSASAAGPLLAATSIGMLLGNGLVGRLCHPATRERLAFPLALLLGGPLLVFALRPPLPAVFGLLLVFGMGFSYLLGIQRAFLDSVPPDLRGRAFGLNSTGVMGGQGVAQPLAGAVASLLGPASTITAIGAAMIAAVLGLRRTLHPKRLAPDADTAAQPEDLPVNVICHR